MDEVQIMRYLLESIKLLTFVIFLPARFRRIARARYISLNLKSNKAMQGMSPEELESFACQEFDPKILERTAEFRRTILFSFIFGITAIISGIAVGLLISNFLSPPQILVSILQVFSAGLILAVTLTKERYLLETWGRKTPEEELSRGVFQAGYLTGTFLLAMSLSI